MVLGYGVRDLKAHMNEIIKVTTIGYRYEMNCQKRGWSFLYSSSPAINPFSPVGVGAGTLTLFKDLKKSKQKLIPYLRHKPENETQFKEKTKTNNLTEIPKKVKFSLNR